MKVNFLIVSFIDCFMLSCFVGIKVSFGCKSHFTLVTGITEHVWEVLRLHMVFGARTVLVGKFVT